jgi:integrase
VVLLKPDPAGRHPHWRARFADPDSGRTVKVKLDSLAISTAEARRAWAVQKARSLAKRRMEIESGAPVATGGTLASALRTYFDAHGRLRPRTLTIYRHAADKLERWGARSGTKSGDDLTRAKLLAFRESLIREPKRVASPGGKRGAYKSTGGPRSHAAVNQELRAIRTVLGYVRDLDLLPKLTHDDLRRALKRLPIVHERIEYLKPGECRQLLESARRHDQETFVITRDEHRGDQAPGTTPRFAAIAPFVAFVLLTGMRLGEAIALQWSDVDLDAVDHDRRKVGEIHLATSATKTKHARSIGLEVSPALRSILAAMKLASGGTGRVFQLSRNEAESAGQRLRDVYGAPSLFTWQALRRTCGTYLTNAPGIFGAASAYRSAKQLGHSVQVAEKHYLDVARGISRDARTLEAAMQIEDVVRRLGSAASPAAKGSPPP